MPSKRRKAMRNRRIGVRRRRYRKKYSPSYISMGRVDKFKQEGALISKSLGNLYPPRLRVRFKYVINGTIGTGAWATGQQIFNLYATVFQPGNTHSRNATCLDWLGPIGQSVATAQPIGFSNICQANFYQFYRDLYSSGAIKVTVAVSGDALRCVTIRMPGDSGAFPTTVQQAMACPYASNIAFANISKPAIMRIPKRICGWACGTTPLQQFNGEETLALYNAGLNIAYMDTLVTYISTTDNQVAQGPVGYDIVMYHTVELSSFNSAGMNLT